ncbi:MAG: sulfotransferase [Gammaproteobacteria bacterium]|nr:sulfotransferase [Gammaproteobacteria bacterium]
MSVQQAAPLVCRRPARESRLSGQSQPVGSVEVALSHATRLLTVQPTLAAEQATEILKVVPGYPPALLLRASARRACGDAAAALEELQSLCLSQPRWAAAQYELGITLGSLGQGEAALMALRRAVELNADLPDAWRVLGDHLTAIGDPEGADAAYARHIKAATKDPRLLAAAGALIENRIPHAEALLRAHLQRHPTDVAAMRMLAEVAARLGRYADAERILATCLELAPSFEAARNNYATVLNRQGKAAAALPQVEQLLAKEPANPGYRNLKAAILANLGDYSGSASIYAQVLREYPQQSKVWMSYGHSLKTSGRVSDAIDAYRRAIPIEPLPGEAWWSLANLKTFRFAEPDVGALRAALARADLSDEERLHFEFALGKALEDRAAYGESFVHYSSGNAIRRKLHPYSAAENSEFVRRSRALFTREFFAARAGSGAAAADPIFILGLPRAGSTLIEQILASHSLVEGTMELPDIPQIARGLARRDGRDEAHAFFDSLAALTGDELRALGERYLEGTRVFRKTAAPYFIDKMPNNCLYVGLIHLMLPNAKIIDARRHPLGCGFSCFKQHFARGQSFTYGLEDLGLYYRDYVELMAHFDTVLPGRVHRVLYEAMVEDTETEVRRLLAHCGLSFEDACLKFYENERAVRTASSEQVRQPIFREGIDQWRHYEPWLEPLKTALGPVLTAYPQVPE